MTIIKIISATYGPSEGHRLLTGTLCNDEAICIPFSRDVAPFLNALLAQKKRQQEQSDQTEEATNEIDTDDEFSDLVRITGRKRNLVPLLGGRKMNTIFGDPCPGTSKRLKIHYVTYESCGIDDGEIRASSASEVHRISFAEHDRVVLRPRLKVHQDDARHRSVADVANDSNEASANISRESCEDSNVLKTEILEHAQSVAQLAATCTANDIGGRLLEPRGNHNPASIQRTTWRLKSATSEIVLPIILPFLSVKERVQCKLVCRLWRHVIAYMGVAKTIDVNDDETFPNFTLPILRGLLAHSHHSLRSLFLSGFGELAKEDLHPAISQLRKLECLDISRCNNLDDSTLLLLAEYVSSTLEVFYLKGLMKVTDQGMTAIARSCVKLQVLEISNVPLTDKAGIEIGVNLTKLRALYVRDNYLLTNRSIDLITKTCTQLSQLTLWGCARLKHLSFHSSLDLNIGCGKLVILNLWGCHSLTDEAARALETMKYLRSLIVSECHKLTDTFLFGLAESAPQLNHLHLRYCKRITDLGVNAIADSMKWLYSLDLSFCSRVTSDAIVNLLEFRRDTLTELRLQNCSHMDITGDPRGGHDSNGSFARDGLAGRAVLNALRSGGSHGQLSVIDLRQCGGHRNVNEGYPCGDPFVQGMWALRFKQTVPGFFQRPTRPNHQMYNDLMANLQQ